MYRTTFRSLFCACVLFVAAGSAWAQLGLDRAGFPIPEGVLGNGGSCFESNGSPGCDDEVCEASVCGYDPFCCDTLWDGICAEEAFDDPNCTFEEGDEARARFLVTKEFTDHNPSVVEVAISCNTGLPLDQVKPISQYNSVVFIVKDYDSEELDCEITETDVNGYSATYQPIPGSENNESCEFENLPWGVFVTCNITNEPDPIEVNISKEWVFENAAEDTKISQEFRVDLWCDSEILEGYDYDVDWHAYEYGEGDEYFTFHVIPAYPQTDCYVEETAYDSAVETDNGCGEFELSAGDDDYHCTITNTVFFEGIPTLSQYGAALMALLMLGIGFVGFRRFA